MARRLAAGGSAGVPAGLDGAFLRGRIQAPPKNAFFVEWRMRFLQKNLEPAQRRNRFPVPNRERIVSSMVEQVTLNH